MDFVASTGHALQGGLSVVFYARARNSSKGGIRVTAAPPKIECTVEFFYRLLEGNPGIGEVPAEFPEAAGAGALTCPCEFDHGTQLVIV
jgi:hypothetical protein